MDNKELERLWVQGSEILRRSIEGNGLKIEEERRKGGKLFLRCSASGHIFHASLLLDSAGWELSVASNNGIIQKSTLSSHSPDVSNLKELIERTGLKFIERVIPDLPPGDTIPKMLESAVGKKKKQDGKGATVQELLRKFNNG